MERQAGRAEGLAAQLATIGMSRANGYAAIRTPGFRLARACCPERIPQTSNFDHTAVAHDFSFAAEEYTTAA